MMHGSLQRGSHAIGRTGRRPFDGDSLGWPDRGAGDGAVTATQRGFSFLEATIASVLVLMMAYLVTSLSLTGMRTQKYAERMARVTEITQDVVDGIRRGLGSSVRLFTADATGIAYRDLLDLGTLPAPLGTSRLPTLSVNGILERDTTGAERTGNDLLFARFAWTDEFVASSGNAYRIDIYRFERFYLTTAAAGPQSDRPDGLNLVHFVSEPLADGTQVDAIDDAADRTEVLAHLLSASPDVHGVRHDPVELVWLVGDDPAVTGTFRQITSSGNLVTTPQAPRRSPWDIAAEPRLCEEGMLFYRHHSVATIYSRDSLGVARFGIADTAGDGFPHGFEIQVVGPAAARQVLLHVTLVSANESGHRAHHDMQLIVDARDV